MIYAMDISRDDREMSTPGTEPVSRKHSPGEERMTLREILQIFGFSRFLKQTLSPSEMGLT
jgi:hypothetical protein